MVFFSRLGRFEARRGLDAVRNGPKSKIKTPTACSPPDAIDATRKKINRRRVPHHRPQLEAIEVFAVHSSTYDARRVPHHEGHGLLGHGLRREDQIALVLAVAVVRYYYWSTISHLLEGSFYRFPP